MAMTASKVQRCDTGKQRLGNMTFATYVFLQREWETLPARNCILLSEHLVLSVCEFSSGVSQLASRDQML
jgi:hypothetical protein